MKKNLVIISDFCCGMIGGQKMLRVSYVEIEPISCYEYYDDYKEGKTPSFLKQNGNICRSFDIKVE